MRWLQKVPSFADEVMFVVWDRRGQPGFQRRYGNVINPFTNLTPQHVAEGGNLKLIHTRVRGITNGTLRDENNKRQYDPSKIATISCSYYSGDPDTGNTVASFSYTKEEIAYALDAVMAIKDENLRAFALQFIYPIVVVDRDYTAMLNDIGAATGNDALLLGRFGGVVKEADVIAHAEALGVEVIKSVRAFDVFTEFGANENENTRGLLDFALQHYVQRVQQVGANIPAPVMAPPEPDEIPYQPEGVIDIEAGFQPPVLPIGRREAEVVAAQGAMNRMYHDWVAIHDEAQVLRPYVDQPNEEPEF